MKNKIWQILLLAVATSFAACSDDFLEKKKNYGSYDENIFDSETTMGWYINKIYYDFFSGYNSPDKMVVGQYKNDWSRSTEEFGGTMGNWMHPNKVMQLSDLPDYYGNITDKVQNNAYTRIRTCTFLIDNIDKKGVKLSDEFKQYAKGQMLFLRAWQYFDLVRFYGGVPLVLEVQNPEAENPAIKLPRTETSRCIEQICRDFEEAARLLPGRWPAEQSNYGRFTRGAALAMKSRVLLFWASPLYNPGMDETRWQSALDAGLAAERQLTEDGFGLYGESNPGTQGSTWHEMFLQDNKFCEEAIIVMLCSNADKGSKRNNGWEKSIRLQHQGGSGGVKAPKEMIDLFPMADGSRPTAANGYDEFKFFMNRDPRFYRTFTFSGRKWSIKDSEEDVVWTYRWKKGEDSYNYVHNENINSPALVCKMSAGAKASEATGLEYSGTDIFEYRYAELLLNIAECYAATGNTAKCTEYLSRIRKRAGLPAANNYGLGNLTDKYKAIEACLYERRVELAYEGKRFWDTQRWMLYNDDPAASNTTCSLLGLDPINGTCRTGNYLLVKNYTGSDDPLEALRADIAVDPDAGDFQAQLANLGNFYDTHFELMAPETAMDNDNKEPIMIQWKQNCYIFGLPKNALEANTWLEQTKGWEDIYGGAGSFDPLK